MKATFKNGRNRNPYRMVAMKAEMLFPRRAKDAKYLENVVTEWKLKCSEVQRYDPKFELAEDTKKTLLMKIIPRDFAKVMRECYDKHDTYDSFEHQLITEMVIRQMEDACHCKSKGLVAECMSGGHYKNGQDHMNYADSADFHDGVWIGAIAPERDREEAVEEESRNVRPRDEKRKGKGKKAA